jgi:hypothetical protein
MAHADPSPAIEPTRAAAGTIRDAFRELHGQRLHGFALLLTLGDRALAARLTARAFADAEDRIAQLRHPERAAAWLRARVLDAMPRRHEPPSPADERAALDPLGVDAAVADGLGTLGTRERAALIAADVERLAVLDVETVTGRRGARLERLLARARRRYMAAYAAAPIAPTAQEGLLVRRIRAVAMRTMA